MAGMQSSFTAAAATINLGHRAAPVAAAPPAGLARGPAAEQRAAATTPGAVVQDMLQEPITAWAAATVPEHGAPVLLGQPLALPPGTAAPGAPAEQLYSMLQQVHQCVAHSAVTSIMFGGVLHGVVDQLHELRTSQHQLSTLLQASNLQQQAAAPVCGKRKSHEASAARSPKRRTLMPRGDMSAACTAPVNAVAAEPSAAAPHQPVDNSLDALADLAALEAPTQPLPTMLVDNGGAQEATVQEPDPPADISNSTVTVFNKDGEPVRVALPCPRMPGWIFPGEMAQSQYRREVCWKEWLGSSGHKISGKWADFLPIDLCKSFRATIHIIHVLHTTEPKLCV